MVLGLELTFEVGGPDIVRLGLVDVWPAWVSGPRPLLARFDQAVALENVADCRWRRQLPFGVLALNDLDQCDRCSRLRQTA